MRFKFLSWIGRNTLGVYLFSNLMFFSIIKHAIMNTDIFIWLNSMSTIVSVIVLFIISMTFSLITVFVCNKFRITQYLFLGDTKAIRKTK